MNKTILGIYDKVKKYNRIAFDYHGVLQKYPREFKQVMIQLLEDGKFVCVMSGPHMKQIVQELIGISGYRKFAHFDKIYSVMDYLTKTGVKWDINEKGEEYTTDKIWWSSKAHMCKKYDIDVLIDDSPQYDKWMKKINPNCKVILIK